MRKVIIIDNNRIGLFDLKKMYVEKTNKAAQKSYGLSIKIDDVIESKALVRKLLKAIKMRKNYEKNKQKRGEN